MESNCPPGTHARHTKDESLPPLVFPLLLPFFFFFFFFLQGDGRVTVFFDEGDLGGRGWSRG